MTAPDKIWINKFLTHEDDDWTSAWITPDPDETNKQTEYTRSDAILSDPRVVALVAAARRGLHWIEGDEIYSKSDAGNALRAALAAFENGGGE